MARFRSTEAAAAAALPSGERHYLAGLLDGAGALRTYRRGDGREVVRLTVTGISEHRAVTLARTFGCGSVLDMPAGSKLSLWQVEGRQAVMRVLASVMDLLDPPGPLYGHANNLFLHAPVAPQRHCLIEDCQRPIRARGLCRRHEAQAAELGLLAESARGHPGRCPLCGAVHMSKVVGSPLRLCSSCVEALDGE